MEGLYARRVRPPDYRLCRQTVTVYHRDGGGAYTRKVFRNAFFEFRRTRRVDQGGGGEESSFLLVIPGGAEGLPVAAGDKVLEGEGPEVSSREEWAGLIPARVPGLAVVRYVDPKYWDGTIVHVEAGG